MPAAAKVKSVPPLKDLYDIGEIPPLGHVPEKMHAWVIRQDRHGPPDKSFQLEVVPTWPIGEDEVLILVMAGGVNYNGVWAGLGLPISPFDVHKQPFHIAGSDASGIVWAIGAKVKRWKVGDEVVVHCNLDDGDDEECNGGDRGGSPRRTCSSARGRAAGSRRPRRDPSPADRPSGDCAPPGQLRTWARPPIALQ